MTKEEALRLVEKMLTNGNKVDKTDLIVEETKISDANTHWIIPVQSKNILKQVIHPIML